jgi:Icc-related predicted phosphoesterase
MNSFFETSFTINTTNKDLKLVHISDTHNNIFPVPSGDILVHSGDFSNNGTVEETIEFIGFMNSLNHKYKILVLGNHERGWDNGLGKGLKERPNNNKIKDLDLLLKGTGIILLHDNSVTIEGIKFYGMPWNNLTKSAFGLPKKDLKTVWENIPVDTQVLVTHIPPYGILDSNNGNHNGSKKLYERVKKLGIPIHLFGHIHEQSNFLIKDNTLFSNAALYSRDQPQGKPVVINIKKRAPEKTD